MEFIPETLLQLLGKVLPLREWSEFLKPQEAKPSIKMQLASSQDSSKEHLGMLWALGCLWIVCTNILLPHVSCTEKENLGGSCFCDLCIVWEIAKYRQTSLERATSLFSVLLVQDSGWLFSSCATDGWQFLSQLQINWHWGPLIFCCVSRWENEKSPNEVSSSIFLSLENQSSWGSLGHCWSSRKPSQDFFFCWSTKLLPVSFSLWVSRWVGSLNRLWASSVSPEPLCHLIGNFL